MKEWMMWSTENINISPGLYHLQIAMMQIGTVQVHICMYVICHHIGCTNKTKLKQNKTSYKLFWCSLYWRQRRSSGFCDALPVSSWYTRLAWPDRAHPHSCQGWYWLMSILYYPRPSQKTSIRSDGFLSVKVKVISNWIHSSHQILNTGFLKRKRPTWPHLSFLLLIQTLLGVVTIDLV